MTAKKGPAKPPKPVGNAVATMPGRNGGTLKRGGTISPGRPLDRIKQAALLGLETAVPNIVKLANAKGEAVKDSDKINAAKFLFDVGGGARIVQTDVQERLKETLAVIRQRCTPELAALILGDMDMIWRVPVHTQGET